MSGDKAYSCFCQPVVMTVDRIARQQFETFCDFVHRITDILAFSFCSPRTSSALRSLFTLAGVFQWYPVTENSLIERVQQIRFFWPEDGSRAAFRNVVF